jgi:hypothetical protein
LRGCWYKREEAAGGRKRLHEMKCQVTRIRKLNVYKISVEKCEQKRQLRRTTRRLEENIRMGLKEIAWIYPDQNKDQWWAVVNMVMNFPVPEKAGNFLSS